MSIPTEPATLTVWPSATTLEPVSPAIVQSSSFGATAACTKAVVANLVVELPKVCVTPVVPVVIVPFSSPFTVVTHILPEPSLSTRVKAVATPAAPVIAFAVTVLVALTVKLIRPLVDVSTLVNVTVSPSSIVWDVVPSLIIKLLKLPAFIYVFNWDNLE